MRDDLLEVEVAVDEDPLDPRLLQEAQALERALILVAALVLAMGIALTSVIRMITEAAK